MFIVITVCDINLQVLLFAVLLTEYGRRMVVCFLQGVSKFMNRLIRQVLFIKALTAKQEWQAGRQDTGLRILFINIRKNQFAGTPLPRSDPVI